MKSHKSKSTTKSSRTKSTKRRLATKKLVINIPVGDKAFDFIDDYNLLDLTIKQAMNIPEFRKFYFKNCNEQLKTRIATLIKTNKTIPKYTNEESINFCKCSMSKLGNLRIRDILDKDKRTSIQLSDCVRDTINSIKTRLSAKHNLKLSSKSQDKKITK